MPASSRSKNVKTVAEKPSDKTARKLETVELLKADVAFAQRLQLYWQLGDWEALEALSVENIKFLDCRAECSLYIASACFQLAKVDKGKTYLSLALQWGAQHEEVHRVLVSGVYNTLAVAYAITNPHDPSLAERAFSRSASIALPGVAVPVMIKARIRNQLEHFNQTQTAKEAKVLLQLSSAEQSPKRSAVLLNAEQLLNEHYLFDEMLQIWCRAQQHEFAYTDGDVIEKRIFDAVKSSTDVSVFSRELLAHHTDWSSEYHLSADRVNLLRPFTDRLSQSSVLELGCGCGAITRFLGETARQVVAVEGSQQRAAIAAERCRDLDNVSVVLDKLQDVPFNGQFDVVTLIGVLEYSQIYVEAEEPIQYVLKKALSYLKDDGLLIVAIENQLGLKYFAGAPEDHGIGIMSGINDSYSDTTAITFGRKELEARMLRAGFSHVETFLPFPDYKLPCLVVHPQGYESNSNFDLGPLLSSSVYYDRQGNASPYFSLESAWPLVARNGLAADLANSHLFVAYKRRGLSLTAPEILASYYSPKRVAATSQELTFFKSNSEDINVRRRRLSELSDPESQTIEKYKSGKLHTQFLHNIIQRNGWTLQEVEAWLQTWLDKLLASTNSVPTDQLPESWSGYGLYLPANFIDAIPRNLIVTEQGYNEFIDLEWSWAHELPLPMVLYRGLVVTLSTITSVAEPADPTFVEREALLNALMNYCGYHLSKQDYQLFVPAIDELSRRAQGFEIAQNPSQVAIALKPFKIRHTGGLNSDDRNIGLTVYWCTFEEVFSEDRSYKATYKSTGRMQTIELNISPTAEPYSRLRLDIADRPGCYIVDCIEFKGGDSDLLWQWDGKTEQLKNIGQLTFHQSSNNGRLTCLLSDGYDPQFEFILSEHVLHTLTLGGTLTITFQSFV